MFNYDREERLFLERIEKGFYTDNRFMNSSSIDYVNSGRLSRDTEAVDEYVNSDDFDIWLNDSGENVDDVVERMKDDDVSFSAVNPEELFEII